LNLSILFFVLLQMFSSTSSSSNLHYLERHERSVGVFSADENHEMITNDFTFTNNIDSNQRYILQGNLLQTEHIRRKRLLKKKKGTMEVDDLHEVQNSPTTKPTLHPTITSIGSSNATKKKKKGDKRKSFDVSVDGGSPSPPLLIFTEIDNGLDSLSPSSTIPTTYFVEGISSLSSASTNITKNNVQSDLVDEVLAHSSEIKNESENNEENHSVSVKSSLFHAEDYTNEIGDINSAKSSSYDEESYRDETHDEQSKNNLTLSVENGNLEFNYTDANEITDVLNTSTKSFTEAIVPVPTFVVNLLQPTKYSIYQFEDVDVLTQNTQEYLGSILDSTYNAGHEEYKISMENVTSTIDRVDISNTFSVSFSLISLQLKSLSKTESRRRRNIRRRVKEVSVFSAANKNDPFVAGSITATFQGYAVFRVYDIYGQDDENKSLKETGLPTTDDLGNIVVESLDDSSKMYMDLLRSSTDLSLVTVVGTTAQVVYGNGNLAYQSQGVSNDQSKISVETKGALYSDTSTQVSNPLWSIAFGFLAMTATICIIAISFLIVRRRKMRKWEESMAEYQHRQRLEGRVNNHNCLGCLADRDQNSVVSYTKFNAGLLLEKQKWQVGPGTNVTSSTSTDSKNIVYVSDMTSEISGMSRSWDTSMLDESGILNVEGKETYDVSSQVVGAILLPPPENESDLLVCDSDQHLCFTSGKGRTNHSTSKYPYPVPVSQEQKEDIINLDPLTTFV